MKILKTAAGVVLAVLMLAYMLLASTLFAVDLSLDENYMAEVLNSSDSFAKLVYNAELSINRQLEEHAEDIVENFGGDAETIDLTGIYSMPEATALFSDVFTDSARFILYGEEYGQVNRELVKNYLSAVVRYGADREVSEEEIDDYLSVGLDAYADNFTSSVSSMFEAFANDSETVDTLRFIFNDVKFLAMGATVIHMLILLLLIRGKTGYFLNAAVFGTAGITMFFAGGGLKSYLGGAVGPYYAEMFAEIFKGRFQLIGAILFAIFAVFMALALTKFIRRTKTEEGKTE